MALTPGDTERLRAAERTLASLRLAGAVVVAGVALLFPSALPGGAPVVLGATAAGGLGVAFLVLVLRPHDRLAAGPASAATFGLDVAYLALLTWATGGLGSPFEVGWYALVASAALRYDGPRTLGAGLVAVGAFLAAPAALGQVLGPLAQPVVAAAHAGFLLVAVGVAAAVGAEVTRHSRAREDMARRVLEAQSAEAKFRGLLQAAPDGIVIVDRQGRVVLVNNAAEQLFGYGSEEMLGQPIEALIPERFRGLHAGHRGQYFGDPRSRAMGAGLDLFGRRKDGTEFPVEISLSPLETEEGLLITSVIRDVSDRKRAEADRLASLERLKELERLRELDSFKTQFINMAAHELGTPLTPIRLQVHLLKNSKEMTAPNRKSIDILDRNVERLGQLVQDVLEVARLQAGRLGVDRKTMDLNRVILESVESFQEPARQAGVILDMRLVPELGIEGDAKRLTQVVFNLLSNAIKFTPRGGRITVESAKSDDMALVHVRDTGVGIRPDDLPRLFQPFSQVGDMMQRTKGGTGLGLYISKGIVELHGGRAWAESPGAGLGSTFSFAVPVRAPTPPPPKPEAEAPEARPTDGIAERAKELV